MPIQTIADALANVGGNISQVLKEEGQRRKDALEAQAQTNELQYRQGLLGLEAQKATAAGQLGLAKAGAEARQFDVTSGQRDTEIAQAGWFQRQQAADAGQRTVIAGKTQAEQVLHDRGLERIGQAQAAAAAAQAQAHMIAARAQAAESAERAASEKLKRDEYNRPVALEKFYDDFLNTVPDGMSPEQHAYEVKLRQSLLSSTMGDIRDYAWDEKTQMHYGPAGRLGDVGKVTEKWLTQTKSPSAITETELQKQISDQVADQGKLGWRHGTNEDNRPIVEAQRRYPNQMLAIGQQIDAKEKEWTQKAIETFRQKNKGTFGGLMSDKEIYEHKDFKDFLKREVDPLVFQAYREASRQMNAGKGQAPYVPSWKTEAPPPTGTPPPPGGAGVGTPTPPPAATPQEPVMSAPVGGGGRYQAAERPPDETKVPWWTAIRRQGDASVPRGGSPTYPPLPPPLPTPAPGTELHGPPGGAASQQGAIAKALENRINGGALNQEGRLLAWTPDGIYQVAVGGTAYRVVVQNGRLVQAGPA